ncbi:hypothetical protein FAZ95_37235 [Trinickia violacea]|uniref:Glycosyl hydrolases family 2 sugar binding domain-containing protein n=1 Tax=Trinickia violacea TaxID=2571746 RepID=A0A4P8J0S0_9BURK|nr:hypothetical protein [Trinickia violacea]QCP54531.1 hypothetical protein FAZ95_37235 [Trinickia violacea]
MSKFPALRQLAILLGILLAFLASPSGVQAQTATVNFVSDTTWAVSNSAGIFLNFAQNVCLNAQSPSNCPANATLYGYPGGWEADLSSIPGATWIWAPGITGATAPAYPAEFRFSKSFDLRGTPVSGTISIAADDFAEILVNGQSVGTIGSLTGNFNAAVQSQQYLHTFDIYKFLVHGTNVITIRAANGNYGCGSGPYSCNPAGVVFGGSLQFQGSAGNCQGTGNGNGDPSSQGNCMKQR